MTLSEDEQNSLDEIGTFLSADDRAFAARLDVLAEQRALRNRSRIAVFGFRFGVATMMLGAAAAQGVFSIGATVSCYGLLLLAWSALTLLRCRRFMPPPNTTPARLPGGG